MKKTVISLLLALVMVVGLVLAIVPQAEAASEHDHANAATMNNHSHEGWTAISSEQDLFDATGSGNYYLAADVDMNGNVGDTTTAATWKPAKSSQITLCLNGFELKRTSGTSQNTARFIFPQAGTEAKPTVLNICDCQGAGDGVERGVGKVRSTNTGMGNSYGQLLHVIQYTTVNIYGGDWAPSNATANRKAGLLCLNAGNYDLDSCELNIYGGTFNGGKITGSGAVVKITKGNVTMHGGHFQSGEATEKGGIVFVGTDCTFTMENGLIEGGKSLQGGNIYLGGVMIMNDGTISGGTAQKTETAAGKGGNLLVTSAGSFTMNDGEITGGIAQTVNNDLKSAGGNINNSGTVAILGGAVTNGQAAQGACITSGGKLTLKDCTISTNIAGSGAFEFGGYVKLSDAQSTTINTGSAKSAELTEDLYLDLNGQTFQGKLDLNGFNLYGMDSQTDDYDISDEVIGKFTAEITNSKSTGALITSGAQVGLAGFAAGVPAAKQAYRYVAIQDNTGYTFHRVYIGITKTYIELNTDGGVNVGYIVKLRGDEKVMENAEGFSMTVSKEGGSNPATFAAPELADDTTIALTIKNILTEGGADNTGVAITGQTSLQIGDVTIESAEYTFTLKQMIEAMDAQWADLGKMSQNTLKNIYAGYSHLMEGWNIFHINPDEAALRQLVLDYMYQMCTIEWTPKETVSFTCSCNHPQTYYAGTTYVGLPYTHLSGSWEQFNSYLENGVITTNVDLKYWGNDCADAVYWAWSQVSGDISFTLTKNMFNENGVIPVGDYDFGTEKDTGLICETNEKTTMYEAYAQLQPGDAVLKGDPSGHVRMVSGVVVKYNWNGTINAKQSYITTYQQGANPTLKDNANSTCSVTSQYTFEALYNTEYIPITIAAFANGYKDDIEVSTTNTALDKSGVGQGTVSSNYRLNSVWIRITDASGNVVIEQVKYPSNNNNDNSDTYNLSSLGVKLTSLTKGQPYTYEVLVGVRGEIVSVQKFAFVN